MFSLDNLDTAGTTMLKAGVVPSTNDIAVDAARKGAEHGWAVCADVQTAGRGRRGHSWKSPLGSLYISIILRPQVPMQMIMGLPAVTGLGVLDALESFGLSGRVGIKWPNDIVSVPREIVTPHGSNFNRKLAGILVEGRSSDQGAFAVAGIGLNIVNPADAPAAPPEVQAAIDAAASVRRQLEHDEKLAKDGVPALEPISLVEALPEGKPLPDRDAVANAVRDAVLARVARWERAIKAGLGAAGPLGPILQSYTDNIPMLGKPVSVLSPNGTELAVGYFYGIDAWGRASVKLGTGEEKTYSAEAVSLREV